MNNFNLIDSMIFRIESLIFSIFSVFQEKNMPDPELMIQAATEHLQTENEKLKEYHRPGRIIEDRENGIYKCPKCDYILDVRLVHLYHIKHCPDCGKRFFTYCEEGKSPEKLISGRN